MHTHVSNEIFERLAHTTIHHFTHESVHHPPIVPATESSEDIDTSKYDSAIDRLKNRLKRSLHYPHQLKIIIK